MTAHKETLGFLFPWEKEKVGGASPAERAELPNGCVRESSRGTREEPLETGEPAESEFRQTSPSPHRYMAFVDFQTRSLVDLAQVGGHNYAAHPATEVLCAVALLPSRRWLEWRHGDTEPEGLFAAVRAGYEVAVHDEGGFARYIWSRLGWPEPSAWIETQHLVRAAGLPAGLYDLSERLLKREVDPVRRTVVADLSRIDRRTGTLPRINAAMLEDAVSHCRSRLRAVSDLLELRLIDVLESEDGEKDVRAADRTIATRGFAFDMELARGVIELSDDFSSHARDASPVDAAVLNSERRLRSWLEKSGYPVGDVERGTLMALVNRPGLPGDVAAAIRARLATSRTAAKKLRSALMSASSDDRIRDTLVYHGAHTGRWSGRRFQPHNLQKGVVLGDQFESAVQAALQRDLTAIQRITDKVSVPVEDVLATLVRPCIRAPDHRMLVAADFSQIEARGVLWAAGDDVGLEVFREYDSGRGPDPYRVIVARLMAVRPEDATAEQRNLGKALVLGCGFGMGAERFEQHASDMGVRWSSVDVSPDECVEAWRDSHDLVAGAWSGRMVEGHCCRSGGLWKACEQAALDAMRFGIESDVGKCHWAMSGKNLICRLPNNRRFCFCDAREEAVETPWGESSPALTYVHPAMGRVSTFGGQLVENIVQAMCRDLLADVLVRAENEGLPVVLHVHDEILCEVPSEAADTAERKLKQIMTTPPDWAKNLPLAVECQIIQRYR